MSEQEMRDEWLGAGGRIHGPHTETVTMPESDYFKFRSNMVAKPKEIDHWLIRKVPNTKDQYFVAEGNPPQNIKDIYNIKD